MLGVMLVSCASQIKVYDGSMLGGDDYCNWNKTDVNLHLGANEYNFFAYYNEKVFNTAKYGDEKMDLTLKRELA